MDKNSMELTLENKLQGIPWNSKTLHGIPWHYMSQPRQNSTKFHGIPCLKPRQNSMEFHRKVSLEKFPWNSMGKFPWKSFGGIPWNSMEFHVPNPDRIPWNSMENFPWNSMGLFYTGCLAYIRQYNSSLLRYDMLLTSSPPLTFIQLKTR